MARPALTDEQRREIRRNIRAAASKLHARNGMKDISARAIAEAAGVSVGTIYSHFGNLTEVMQSLWKQPSRILVQDMESVAAETPDPIERLKRLFQIYIEFSETKESVYRGAYMFVRPEEHESPEKAPLASNRMYALFRQAVIEGQHRGVFRTGDPDTITQAIWSGIHGAIALPKNFDRLALDDSNNRTTFMFDLLFEWLTNTNSAT